MSTRLFCALRSVVLRSRPLTTRFRYVGCRLASNSDDARLQQIQRRLQNQEQMFEDDPAMASGETTVTILNKELDDGILYFEAYSTMGFRMNTGLRVVGPCAVFPKSILHWNIGTVDDINEDSLSLFTMLEPKIDILVIGVGEPENISKVKANTIVPYLTSQRINVEILPTEQALSTFNFLNSEKRCVAGAFLPPSFIREFTDDELLSLKQKQGSSIFELENIDTFEHEPKDLQFVVDGNKKIIERLKGKVFQTEEREKEKQSKKYIGREDDSEKH